MDALFKVLSTRSNISDSSIARLRQYIEDEEYESDSIQDDAGGDLDGNLSNHMGNKEMMKVIHSMVKKNKCMYIFFYFKCFNVYNLNICYL